MNNKLKICLVVLFILLIGIPSWAGGKWDTTDKVLMGSFIGLNAVDYMQTRYIFDHPNEYYEKNPVLKGVGEDWCPLYFLGISLGAWYVADKLKPNHRKIFLGILNGIQIYTVGRNFGIGIKLSF